VVEQGGQSVIVDQIGDWLVCEDAMGHFFHHTPTQGSYDNPPPEFLMLFPTGYTPPPLGAFAAAPMMAPTVVEQVIPGQVAMQPGFGGVYMQQPGMPVQLGGAPMQGMPVQMQGMQTQGMPFQGVYGQQLPPVMAKVL
jgi:hypothetical protein